MTISEIENNAGNPRLHTLEAIAKALRTDLASLFARMREDSEAKRRRLTDAELTLLDAWARLPAGVQGHWRALLEAAAEEADRRRLPGAKTEPPPEGGPHNPDGVIRVHTPRRRHA
jgi:transcriptional regulator with XRE-family HTH domain